MPKDYCLLAPSLTPLLDLFTSESPVFKLIFLLLLIARYKKDRASLILLENNFS